MYGTDSVFSFLSQIVYKKIHLYSESFYVYVEGIHVCT